MSMSLNFIQANGDKDDMGFYGIMDQLEKFWPDEKKFPHLNVDWFPSPHCPSRISGNVVDCDRDKNDCVVSTFYL